jgi:hypothetical protein
LRCDGTAVAEIGIFIVEFEAIPKKALTSISGAQEKLCKKASGRKFADKFHLPGQGSYW